MKKVDPLKKSFTMLFVFFHMTCLEVFTELTFYKYIIDIWDENYHVFRNAIETSRKFKSPQASLLLLSYLHGNEKNKAKLLTMEKDKKLPSVQLKRLKCLISNV